MSSRGNTTFIIPQWITGTAVLLLLIQIGILGGWSSPSLALLSSPDSPMPVDPEQASWIASLVNLGRFAGAILGAVLTNYFGSKRSILITLVPMSIGWCLIFFANSAEWLYLARLSGGLGLGMGYGNFPLFIGEVSMPEIRGALISLATLGAPIGQLLASVCGSYMSLGGASLVYLGLAIANMILFWWLPESPHYLIQIGNKNAAKEAIAWYRAGKGVESELEAVDKFVNSNRDDSFMDKVRQFNTPSMKKATIQIVALFSFAQLSGLNVIIFYMETILIRAKFTFMSPFVIVIIINAFSMLATGLSIFLIDRCGRRFLLLVASIGITMCMVGLSTFFLIADDYPHITELQWLPVVSLFLFMMAWFVGFMPVPSAILSETFPAKLKCIASGVATLTGAITSFLSAKSFQPFVDLFGEGYVFLIYGFFAVIVIPYILFVMMETKGKSLQQIQDDMEKK